MQFTTILSLLAVAVTGVAADAASVAWDAAYDDAGRSTLTTSCSDGVNGLFTKGFSTLGQLPTFPRVGAASTVAGWNSPNCGTCYTITYGGRSINVIAVDHAASGFVLSKAAMNQLTNNQADMLGRVNADFAPAAQSACGL